MDAKSGLRKFVFGSIGNKILLGFLLVNLLVVLVGYFSLMQIEKIAYPLREQIPYNIESMSKTSNLEVQAQFIRYYDEVLTQSVRNYAFTQDKKWADRYRDAEPKLDSVIKGAIQMGDEEDKKTFSSIDSSNLALVNMEYKAIDLVEKGNPEEAINILESDEYWTQKQIYSDGLKTYLAKTGIQYDEVRSASTAMLEKQVSDIEVSIDYSRRLIIVLMIISFLLAVGTSIYITRLISIPVKNLHKATEMVEKGDFNVCVEAKTGDELEELCNAFNKTASVLKETDDMRKQLDHAKSEFLSITSHELRSPMTPMKAQLQMLLAGYFGSLSDKQKQALEIVERNTSRLDKIILDFLEISRIEAARLKFNFVKTDLSREMNSLIEEMKAFMPEKNIEVVFTMERLPVVEIDPDRVGQVLRNLINNAKKFSPENSKIFVNIKLEGERISFSVRDQGIGISREGQKRIFEPFYQAEQTMYRKYGGTGLGLAICRGIVESQGGRIRFESETDKGTVFYFTFPVKPVKDIKPIKVLFSNREIIEKAIKELFLDYLGPLGEHEFDEIKKEGFTEESLLNYVDKMYNLKVITDREEFKNRINLIFGNKTRPIDREVKKK